MDPLTICAGLALLFAAAGFISGVHCYYDLRKWRQARGWVITNDRMSLLKEVEARPEQWAQFKDAPSWDPRFSWGRRVHDLIEAEKSKAAEAEVRTARIASALDFRNRELEAQTKRADELMEDLDDAHRELEEARTSYVSPSTSGTIWVGRHDLS